MTWIVGNVVQYGYHTVFVPNSKYEEMLWFIRVHHLTLLVLALELVGAGALALTKGTVPFYLFGIVGLFLGSLLFRRAIPGLRTSKTDALKATHFA